MKVLLITEDVPSQHLGGAGKHAVLLGNALIEAGYEVELLGLGIDSANQVIALGDGNGFLGKLHLGIDISGTGLKSVAMGIFFPLRGMFVAWRIWQAVKRLDYSAYDVIHYHGHVAELGIFVPKRINYVHTLHDQGSECMTMMRFKNGAPCQSASAFDCAACATKNKPNFLQKIISATAVKLHRYLSRKAFTKHKAIFVSEFVMRRFKEVLGNAEHINATVIHNFTDAYAMQRLIKQIPIVLEKNTCPVVLIAGRVHSTKGQGALLDAIPDNLLKQIEVRIAGDGPDLIALKEKHEKRGVVFLGWLSQQDVYKQTMLADACVVPSIWEEPFGATSLEAIVLGKVVFALNRGGTPELTRYSQYPNQLRLFDDIASMLLALTLIDYVALPYDVSLQADVTARLPEILQVYSASVVA
jgi:glycosyltransferase involved in cell wall biosynthesis